MTVFGVIGYAFRKLDCEPAPLLLGLVLGPMLEENFRRAMVLSDGDWSVFVQPADQPRLPAARRRAAAGGCAAEYPSQPRAGVSRMSGFLRDRAVNQRMVASRNCPNYDADAALGSSRE